jgi:hypothetical protein
MRDGFRALALSRVLRDLEPLRIDGRPRRR